MKTFTKSFGGGTFSKSSHQNRDPQSFTTQPCTSGGRKKNPKKYHSHSTLKSYKIKNLLVGTLCVKKNREIDSNEQSLCNNIASFFLVHCEL